MNLLKKIGLHFFNLRRVLDKGKTNYTVYESILNLFVSAMRKAHDLIVETEYVGVLYIIVRVIFFSFCCKFHRLENGIS